MKTSIDAILAQIVLQEYDRIIATGQEPTLEALLYRMELRRGEVELASQAIKAFQVDG